MISFNPFARSLLVDSIAIINIDFCGRVYDGPVSAEAISKFLKLLPSEALFQVLNYRRLLIEAKLAPSTINVRLSALKSLVDYARKMGECQ